MQVSGDIATQTRRTLENIDRTLKAQGSSLERAVSMMVYLKNAADFAAMNEVYKTFFPRTRRRGRPSSPTWCCPKASSR